MNRERAFDWGIFWTAAGVVVTISTLTIGSAVWMTSSIHQLKDEMNAKFNDIDRRLVRIETVLVMQGIMPLDLAIQTEEK